MTAPVRSAFVLVLTLTTALGCATEQPQMLLLRHNWAAQHTSRYLLSGRGDGELIVHGLAAKQPNTELALPFIMGFDTAYTQAVNEVDEQGNATIQLQWEPIQASTDVRGKLVETRIDFAAGTITVNGTERPLGKQWTGVGQQDSGGGLESVWPPVIRVSPRGQILEFHGLERYIPHLRTAGLQHIDPPRWPNLSLVQFPEDPVSVGETWEYISPVRASTLTQSTAQRFASTGTYTLAGFETINDRQCAKITMACDLELIQPPASPAPTRAKLKVNYISFSMTGTGTLYFDYQAGQMVNSDFTVTVNSHANISLPGPKDAAGKRTTQTIEQHTKDLVLDVRINLAP